MKIGITAPVFVKNVEHKKYLDLTTRSFKSTHDLVWIPIENYVSPEMLPLDFSFIQQPKFSTILKPEGQQSVSKAWNMGIQEAQNQECDYVMVINTDIVFKSNAIDRLVAFAETHPEFVMWTMAEYSDLALLESCPEDENFSEHPHFSCFMVKPDFFKYVGKFDENFVPAYCEDGDMHARIALANQKAVVYGGARFYHFGSRVIKSDAEEWQKNGISFPKNQQYFLTKWGHPPVGDVDKMREVYFKHPYNESDKNLDYWR